MSWGSSFCLPLLHVAVGQVSRQIGLGQLMVYDGFSDIEFNPERSINC